ncbi:hypothetical protein ACFYWO_19705 [Streptomyces sp. NPDC002932]|uniref:hypothetical protein n=1 Tax=Streptomyces sp. NPDC002932 TaxID=3364672 RepID=UPI0036A30386
MRDLIARTLAWVLSVLTPRRPGRHSVAYLSVPAERAPASPWSCPWTAPSSAEVRAIFGDERTRELPELQRERVYAAAFARLGVDYDFPTMALGSIVRRERAAA